MSAATANKPKEAPPVILRPAQLLQPGDPVFYYEAGQSSSSPEPAIVTKTGNSHDMITLNVLTPDLRDFRPRDGVRHMSDPKVARDPGAGGWDFHPTFRRLIEVERRVAELETKLKDLGD
jgi:hypothetical protein